MQVNKLLKGLAIALPIFTLAACGSSKSSTESMEMESNKGQVATDAMDATLVTPLGGAQGDLTPEQVRNNELRQSHTVLFEYDNFSVLPQYEDVLEAHAQFLLENPTVQVIVEGHTDARGTPEYNISLGERRANAIATYLQVMGVPVAQISLVSYGEEKPMLLGHTEADYSKNRRAVLVY